MKYKIQKNIINYYKNNECIVIGIYKNNKIKKNIPKYNLILNEIKKYNFNGKINTSLIIKDINTKKKEDYILIGCGEKKKINENKFKKIIKNSFNIIKKLNYQNIMYSLNNIYTKKKIYWKIFNIIKIFEKKKYFFNKFKNKYINKYKNIKINFLPNKKEEYYIIKKYIKKSLIIFKGIKICKDLCNTPPNICNSLYIYKEIKNRFKNSNVKISYLNKKKMSFLGMNAYLSVNKGSYNEPIMVILKYNNNKNMSKPIILIGKGITFDTGGISIKPSINMHNMKYDMSGAASIYGIIYIISKLKLKINIIGILTCAENSINGNSSKPGDIITTLSKKTIEIINTDAEGRLLLCDTLTYIKKFNPKFVIDIATLTGSCVIALGKKINGMLSNNKKLSNNLLKSSIRSGEYIHELPLFKKYNKYLKSNIADIKNCTNYPYGGTIIAACFLSYFTKKYKWAHIDIAGTAYNSYGSTGQPINIIIQFLTDYIKKKYEKKI